MVIEFTESIEEKICNHTNNPKNNIVDDCLTKEYSRNKGNVLALKKPPNYIKLKE